MSVVIYKAIFGDYDELPLEPPLELQSLYKFKLYTDRDVKVKGWEVFHLHTKDPILANRHCKMLPWNYFTSEKSIYLDGHIEFGIQFSDFINHIISLDEPFIMMRHRSGGNTEDELIRAIDNSKLSKEEIKTILSNNIVLNKPSPECGFIYRNHTSKRVRTCSSLWWDYFNKICMRDQILIHTASRDANLEIKIVNHDFSNTDYFKIVGHKNTKLKLIIKRLRTEFKNDHYVETNLGGIE